MKVAIARIAAVFLDRDATVAKVADRVRRAAEAGRELVVFGESPVPGLSPSPTTVKDQGTCVAARGIADNELGWAEAQSPVLNSHRRFG